MEDKSLTLIPGLLALQYVIPYLNKLYCIVLYCHLDQIFSKDNSLLFTEPIQLLIYYLDLA